MGSLGMPEILLILVIALIVFGPRKLPELGKSLGQSLAQFRKASEDFKRQWEDEVVLERNRIASAPTPVEETVAAESAASAEAAASEHTGETTGHEEHVSGVETGGVESGEPATIHRDSAVAPEPKRDWT